MEQHALSEARAHTGAIGCCKHCGSNAAKGQEFCCSGCEVAYQTLHQIRQSAGIFSPFATQDAEGYHTLTLNVKGIHCASCIRLIENALYGEKDVLNARVNMSTNRLTFTWKGERSQGDTLASAVEKLGYKLRPFESSEDVQQHYSEEKFLLRCIAVSGFASGNLMLLSFVLWTTTAETLGLSTRDLFHWVSALISLPTIIYAGRPFFSSAFAALKERHTNMDVPISIGVIGACAMSLFETVRHGEHAYFDSAVMLLFFLLIGRYLDTRAKGKAREYAQGLLSMLGGTATVLQQNGTTAMLPIRELREGMVVLVAAGENIPADGTVAHGNTELDMSLITGETLPQHVQEGSTVFAGTTNLNAPLRVIVAKASDDSLLSDIVKLMEKAEQGQARYVRLADKVARLYTPVVHALGLLAFLGWWLGMGLAWQPSLLIAITVLIITCPCALGLAVPVVQVLASSLLMKCGILLKSGDALEKLAAMDTVVFDKTGTLTLGKPELTSSADAAHLRYGAALAAHSKHPLSQALCRTYTGTLPAADSLQEYPGKGLEGKVEGKTIRLGSHSWCGDNITTHHAGLELWLAIEGEIPIQFIFSDKLRVDARQVISQLREGGIRILLLSGDREETVAEMARAVGITEYRAALSPLDKTSFIEQLKAQGCRVGMVGDGLNDAPALATAHVSLSPATAIDITQNAADIVFQGEKLAPVYEAWRVACRSNTLVKQNFMLASLYNIVAIPLAMLGYVTPMIAAIAMSSSSLIVIGNSFRLWRKR